MNKLKAGTLWGAFFVSILAIFGLFACGGGTEQVVALNTPAANTPAANAPVPISGVTSNGSGGTTITANNSLSNGDIVTISGTNSALDGTQAVSNTTPTTFDVNVPPPPSIPPGATFTPPPTTLAGCSTTGATNAITLSAVPSRVSGVAPLAVFFDATGTTATATTRPFHDLEYRWDFGENLVALSALPQGAFWANGSRAGSSYRGAATGPVAAHVFELPGTYTVALTVTDGTNSVSNSCLQILVADPDTVYSGNKTACVSTSGDFSGCPAGATTVTTSNFSTSVAAITGSNVRRVLFHGGETFTTATTSTFTLAGPAQIGAYGVGKPIIQWTGATSATGVIRIGGTASDLRIAGIEFDGQNQDGVFFMSFQNSAWSNLLLLNNNVHGWGAFMQPDWGASGGFGFFAVGNSFVNPSPGMTTDMALVSGGSIAAILGNNYSMNARGQQVVRMNNMQKFIVSDNNVSGAFGTAGNQKETIAMRSSATRVGQFGVISGNSISVGPGYVGVFPSSANTELGVFDVIIDGNYIFGAGSGLPTNGIQTNAERITIRNNIIDASDANMNFGITLRGTNGGFSLPSKDVKVYNNSVYSSKAAGALTGISVDTDVASGNVIANNLVYTSVITGTAVLDSASKATRLTNTGDVGSVTVNPNWTIAAPMTPLTNFQPIAGSYAIDTGTAVPVFSDFFGAPRAGTYDLGAVNP